MDLNMDRNINDPIIKCIYELRKKIRPIVDNMLSTAPREQTIGYRNKLNIISDAIVYLTIKNSDNYSDVKENNAILNTILDKNKLSRIFELIMQKPITFENAVSSIIDVANTTKKHLEDVKNIISRKDLDDKPEIRLALQMYLLKGKFRWVPYHQSSFYNFLHNDSTSSLPDDAPINCWEAVMYGMLKTGLISKNELKKKYRGIHTLDDLSDWLNFSDADKLSYKSNLRDDWTKILSKKPYFIMIDDAFGDGMNHDMVSVPFSQKQLLKMMITEKFEEPPLKPKLYSHWVMWTGGSLGSVKKDEFSKYSSNSDQEVRIRPVSFFSKNREKRCSIAPSL